ESEGHDHARDHRAYRNLLNTGCDAARGGWECARRDARAVSGVAGRVAVCFESLNFRETSPVSFFTREPRRYERTHDLEREFNSSHARAETQHIAIVVFA